MSRTAFAGAAVMAVFFAASLGATAGAAGFETYDVPSAHALPTRLAVDTGGDTGGGAESGTVWFVESNTNKIGKFQPGSGTFTEYDIPTRSSFPSDITVDPSGKVWFTEQDANQLGSFDPVSRSFQEFDIPTIDSLPRRLVSDRRGNIWFTEFYGGKVAKFDPRTGTFEEYPVPTPDSRPTGIAIDGAGRVWFVETQGNKLGVVDPENGAIREFDMPAPLMVPEEIVVDASGVIWFSARRVSELVSFDPSTEHFQTFALPNRAVPQDLAVDGRGNVVFPLTGTGKLGLFKIATGRFLELRLSLGDSRLNGVDIDAEGNLWVTDIGNNTLIVMEAGGVSGLWLD